MTSDARALLGELLAGGRRVDDLDPAAAAELLVELTVLQARLAARIRASGPAAAKPESGGTPDRLIAPRDAADALGVTVRWLYRHADELPFTRRLSRKTLRFSEAGLNNWITASRGGRGPNRGRMSTIATRGRLMGK